MKLIKKSTLMAILICLGLIIGSIPLYAQGQYPSREIEVVIGWSPGGGTDTMVRIFANELAKFLKVPITPLNKPGASSTVGAEYVRKAKKDGYTILGGSTGWTLGCVILADAPHNPLKDFIPITKISTVPQSMFVKSDSPYKSLEDFISIAKKNPKSLSVGTPGPGSEGDLNMVILQKAAGIELNFLPFKGGNDIAPSVLGGHIDAGSGSAPGVLPYVKAGKIRYLAVSGNDRMKQLPEVPTFREKGINQTFVNWAGIWVPVGVPQDVIDTLTSACEKALKSKEFIAKINALGGSIEYMSREKYRKEVEAEMKLAESIAVELGMIKAKK